MSEKKKICEECGVLFKWDRGSEGRDCPGCSCPYRVYMGKNGCYLKNVKSQREFVENIMSKMRNDI